ncbi:YbaB/EbfC family nucleoid-associated protein [Nocardia sp. NPDC004604]|uniref:YbaB/EbfC family nucleoid-associated protein n=1 Tax=Nocardia sp. NPDC004604 TaxID=3157013 RepID=UPI00339FB338
MTEANFGYLTDVSAAVDALRSHAERMLELNKRICAIRVEETSPDGAVTVIVDGEGRLVDIHLSHSISRLTPTEFGQCLVDTSRAAARRAVETQAALVAAFNDTDADSSDSS